MKINCNFTVGKIFLFAAALLGMLVFVSPVVFAQQQSQKNFCTQLTVTTTKISDRLEELRLQLEAQRADEAKRLTDSRAVRTEQRTENRTRLDALRAENITAVEARAKTNTQKQTVAAFKASLSAAVTNRRAGIDAAVQTFQRGVDQAITSRKGSVDAAVITFKTSVAAAIDRVMADCALGGNQIAAHKVFIENLMKARQKMLGDRQIIEKVQVAVASLLAARHKAIQKAETDFQAALQKARVDLKTAFGESASASVSTSTNPQQ